MNLGKLLLHNALYDLRILKFDRNTGGNLLTLYQSLEIQRHNLTLHAVVINVFYNRADLFISQIQNDLRALCILADKPHCILCIKLKRHGLLHLASIQNTCCKSIPS